MRVELDVHRPLLLRAGEGETITDRPGRTIRILADVDLLTLSWFRSRRDGREEDARRFDQFEPPEDGGRPLSDSVLSGSGEGERIESRSSLLVKAGAHDGDGHLTLLEADLPPGYPGPPLHLHRRTVETFFVLSGAITLRAGEADAELQAGDFAVVPAGLLHTFSNPTDQACRCAVVAAPGGVDGFLREAASADPAEFPALGARYDTFFER